MFQKQKFLPLKSIPDVTYLRFQRVIDKALQKSSSHA